ncbi:MAG TPA: aspartyl protease family protein [Gemmataceae bacterium]|jgi:hypothetical protein|nr:aspartyl protease family protein [Gemmataceae bacterium]
MPQLAFPVTVAGLALPVMVGIDGKTSSALFAAGKSIAAPIQARGLLDTGSDITAIASWVLQKLALPIVAKTVTSTAAGQINVNLYEVSLSITNPVQPNSPWLTLADLQVTELSAVLTDADVLIGLDVILQCRMIVDGPARFFSLDF